MSTNSEALYGQRLLRGVETCHVDTAPKSTLYFVCKRLLDLTATSFGLLLISPLLLLIAIAIKFDSKGPVFFVQERIGARRKRSEGRDVWELIVFRCYKFRSMFDGCDQSPHQKYIAKFCAADGEPDSMASLAPFKLSNDERITRVGRLLRNTSLDELPQLFNVMSGEMSLVGPRPVPVYEVAMYGSNAYERLAATPGITGLWQIKGRGRAHFAEMVQLDAEYVRRCSFWLDLKILVFTIPAVLAGTGAR